MRSNYAYLKAGVAITALAFALPTASHAFDDVDWDWTKRVNEVVDIDVDIDADIDLPNMVEVEKFQFMWGNVTATATVDYFQNDAFRPVENGTVTFSQDFEAEFSDTVNYTNRFPGVETATNPISAPNDLDQISGDPSIDAVVTGGNVDEQDAEIDLDLLVTGTITGEVDVEDLEFGALSAVDLPRIENAATAVGNNQSIESTSALFLHDGQFLVGNAGVNGEFNGGFVEDAAGALAFISGENGNEHNEIAGLLLLGGLAGAFAPAEISATATVGHDPCDEGCEGVDNVAAILNASVDNSATAVANNVSVNLDGADAASNTMIADLTQFAYANVSATATVNDVLLDGYEGFGLAGFGGSEATPIIRNVATAVGNNVAISVGVPDID